MAARSPRVRRPRFGSPPDYFGVERSSLTDDLPITDLTWPYHEEDIKMTLNAAKSGSFKMQAISMCIV